jgi:O-antigen/teichoic acid export membrane protein
MLISFLGELFNGRYRAAQKAYIPMILSSFQAWIELLFIFTILNFSTQFDSIAFSVLCSTILYLLIYQWLSLKAFPKISFSIKQIKLFGFKRLFKKGFAFQAFPLGNALLFQGNLLIVQVILGPAAVALFGTVRTMVRTINQGLELINKSIWPEMSYLFGAGDSKAVVKLHRAGVGFSIIIAFCGIIFLGSVGVVLYELWVGKVMILSYHLLLLFLVSIPFNALWTTSSVVLIASNQHEGLAKRYVLATSMAAIACGVLSFYFGIEGAAVSVTIADLILIPYVLKQSLRLTEDSYKDFIPGVIEQIRIIYFEFVFKIRPPKTI